MTALIIGLIAALGIGGGIAVANNSGGGGGGGGGTEISGPAVPGDDGGSGNEGGDNQGGNQGSGNEGGDNTGGNQGGNQGGSDNPGGDNTGGNNPGNPASKLNPDYNLISALTDNTQYKNIVSSKDLSPAEYHLINDGTGINYRKIYLGTDGESILVDTGVLREENGYFVPGSNGYMEDKQTLRFTAEDKAEDGASYNLYQKDTSSSNGSVRHLHKLYLGGSKTELSTADFGFWIEWRNGAAQYNRYTEIYWYDKDYLYTGSRSDTVNFAGNALMVSEDMNSAEGRVVKPGSFAMTLDMAEAKLTGKIDMGISKYNVDFSGTLSDKNQLKFEGNNVVHEYSHGYLLQGKDGLETMGNIYTSEGTNDYTFGAKEVK